MKITLSSSPETPQEEQLYVIEYPSTTRVKMRYIDVQKEIESIERDALSKAERKKELEDIKKEMDKLR